MRIISAFVCAIMLILPLASCTVPENSLASSDEETSKYVSFLEEKLPEMPDSLVVASGDDAAAYGVDMSDFSADGYITRADSGDVIILGKSDEGLDRAVRDFVKHGNADSYEKTYGEGYRVKKLTIDGNDISDYVVVYDDVSHSSNVAEAASELVIYVEKTCGVCLTACTASAYESISPRPAHVIRLTVDADGIGNESYRIEVANGNLTIYGGFVRGCTYGVYDLLWDDIGWRFMYDVLGTERTFPIYGDKGKHTVEYLYESEHIDLTSAINRTEEPLFGSRRMDDGEERPNNIDDKMRISANWYSGHGLTAVDFSDTYYEGRQHMEQPCLNNEEIIEAIDNYVVSRMEWALSVGYIIGRDFHGVSIGQFDGPPPCNCKECLKVLREEKSRSGSVIRMANHAAELLLEHGWEGVHINVLAYMDTDAPPAVTTPLENVRVAFCFYYNNVHITCNAHTVDGKNCSPDEYASNCAFAEKLEKWAEICAPGTLDVWYYPFQAYNIPVQAPMITNLYDDIKYISEQGVDAIINTTMSHTSDGHIQTLAAYLLNMICWELPESYEEFDALIREWFYIQYGDAWEPLYEYLTEYEKIGKLNGCHSAFFADTMPKAFASADDYLPRFDCFVSLFEEAKELVDTEYQYRLVERYESGMLYLGVGLAYEEWYLNGTESEREKYFERYREMHRIFTEYKLPIYLDFLLDQHHYAPETLNLNVDPFTWLEKFK